MITKVMGFLIVAAAGFIVGLALKDDLMTAEVDSQGVAECSQQTPAEQVIHMINQDFQGLKKEKQLPEAWIGIKTIEYKMGSTLAKALIGESRPDFPLNPEGHGHLEVEVMDLPDDTNPGFILQISLFDLKTKNKIFEIGRSYMMSDLNHLKETPSTTPQPKEDK